MRVHLSTSVLVAALTLWLPQSVGARQADPAAVEAESTQRASDLAAARAVFSANLRAIQERNREDYLGTYLNSDRLVRTGPSGFELGWEDLAAGAAPTGSDDWPAELLARDLRLQWLQAGLVYGTYRYRVSFDGLEWVEGISERLFTKTEGGWKIAVTTAFGVNDDTPSPPVALVGATVHDGLGGPPIQDALLILRGGKIESVGPRARNAVPLGLDVIELTGKHIIPGLIDTHVHYSQTGWVDGRPDAADVTEEYPYAAAMALNQAHPDRFHRAFLSCGVTSVFDVGGYPWTRTLPGATELSREAPHVVAAGPLIATFDPGLNLLDRRQMIFPSDEDEARAMVRSHAASGSQAIKFWFVVRSDDEVAVKAPLLMAVGEEAKAVGLPLIVHATRLAAAKVAVAAGASLLVHSVENRAVDDEFVGACVAAGTSLSPTLTVVGGYAQVNLSEISDEVRSHLAYVHPSVAERVLKTVDLPLRGDPKLIRASFDARAEATGAIMAANLVALHRAGVPIVLGTDAGNPLTLHGPSVFPELEAMEAAGLSPSEVLVSATSKAAAALGRAGDLGRIEPGFVADLVVLTEDPSKSSSAMRSVTHVVRAGTVHRRDQLVWD